MLRWVVRAVVRLCMEGHVPEDILGLDLKEEAVGVGVEELATIPVLPPELVVVEVIHQMLGETQNAHPHEHRANEHYAALVDLDSHQVVVEDIGPSKCWAGDEAPEFVFLMQTHQLHINLLPQVLHGLPEDRVVHQLVEVLLGATSSVFIRMYGSIQGLWSNRRAWWISVRCMPRNMYSCRFR